MGHASVPVQYSGYNASASEFSAVRNQRLFYNVHEDLLYSSLTKRPFSCIPCVIVVNIYILVLGSMLKNTLYLILR